MKSFFKKAKKFVGHDVWEKTEADFSSRKEGWFVRQARLILYTAQGVQHHNTVVRSAALTFFTLMSLVPMLALAFGIIKGFGLETALENYLFERFSENSALIRYILNFANNVLVRTSGGLVAASGLVVLVWAAIRVFGNVENAFNTIWEVQKPRSLTRRASTYAAVIFVMPLLAVMLALVLSYIRTLIANYASIPYSVLYAIGSFAVLWLLFAGAYKIIPNTKVRFRHAAMAALIAAIAFSVFQLVYVTLQSGVSSYNIIYGSFAAVPLFLFWIQASWQIVLFGAELSFSYQNVESFVQEQDAASVSYDNRRKVMLASLTVIIRSFMRGEGGISSEAIARELKLPVRLVRDINYTLDEAGMILPISSDKSQKTKIYVPARDIHTLTLHEAVRAVERAGSAVRDLCGNRYLREISGIMDEIDRKIDTSDDNILLMELIKDGDNDNRER